MLLSTTHVWIASQGTSKLLPRYIGPFKIEARQGPLAYRLELPDHDRMHPVFYLFLLKAYKAAPHRKPPPPPDIIGDEEESEVEDILQRRHKGRMTSYLVKWTGYGQETTLGNQRIVLHIIMIPSGNIGHVIHPSKMVLKG